MRIQTEFKTPFLNNLCVSILGAFFLVTQLFPMFSQSVGDAAAWMFSCSLTLALLCRSNRFMHQFEQVSWVAIGAGRFHIDRDAIAHSLVGYRQRRAARPSAPFNQFVLY